MKKIKQTQDIQIIQKQLSPIAEIALHLKIDSDTALKEASELRSQVKDYEKKMLADKKKLTDPAKATLEEIKSRYRPFEAQIEVVLEALDRKMIAYQTEIATERAKQEEKIANKVQTGYLKMETAVDKISNLQVVEKKVETESGGTTFISKLCFEVVSLADVPLEFHLPDMVALRKQMLAGVEVKGCRYWTEQRPRNN